MLRTTKYCDRYEIVPFDLDTPVTIPVAGANQKKTGYSFNINDRTFYYDWYKAYFGIKFKVVKNDNTNFGVNDRIAPISDAASLISSVSLNGRALYDSSDAYRMINVKNLLTKFSGYSKIISTNEFYFPDEQRTTVIDRDSLDLNSGFRDRQLGITEGKEVDAIIPLNKYSFFEGLNTNILPPTQVKLVVKLTDDDTALYRDAGVDDGKVIVTELVLWLPRLNLNAEGMKLVMERYLSPNTTWSYLREFVTESASGRQLDKTWRISDAAKKPRHVFVYLQKADKENSQTENVHILDTFSMGRTRLFSARLEAGAGVHYPETEYSLNYMYRIYRDVIEYSHNQDNKDTDLFLTRDRFENLYGMLYFNLKYNSDNLDLDPVKLILKFKLNRVPTDDYKAYAIILCEETVMVNMVGDQISIV